MLSKRLPTDALGPSVSVSKLLSSSHGMVEDTRVTTEPRDLAAHGQWRFQERLICFQARLKTAGAPPFANTVLAWLVLKTHVLSSNLAQAGGWWGATHPVCKHTARIVNGRVSKKTLIMHGGLQQALQKTTQRLLSKLAHGFKPGGGGGFGGAQPPPPVCIALARLASKTLICCQASCTSGGLGGAAAPQLANTPLAW